MKALKALGGLEGIEKALATSLKKGLSSKDKKDLETRRQEFGRNEVRQELLPFISVF